MRIRKQMEATVYRVSPGPADTWRVSIGAEGAIASFNDKSAAVRFALSLAHGEARWHPPAAPASGARYEHAGK